MHEVETYYVTENERVTIFYDDDDMNYNNPRDWDNLGTMVCWHSRYDLGDEQPTATPSEYLESLPKGTVTLPLYLYDHGGITMSTSPFSCPWDSGQVGFIYATPEDIAKNGADLELTVEILKGEVKTYDQYLRGEVYGYVIESGETCDHGDTHWERVDSCWGYFGDEGIEQIKSEWPPALAKVGA